VSALLYLSDHGENLKDDERELSGHFHYNKYDLPVPMVFWYSDAWAARYPEKLAAATRNAEALRLNTQAVFHSLVDMIGASVHDPSTERLSVFSPMATPPPRLVDTEFRGVEDYDLVLNGRRPLSAERVAPPAKAVR
jgi:hypothetical protein